MNLERVKQKHVRYWLSDSTASHVKGKDASLTSIICCHHWAIQTAGICIATTTDGLATAYRSASSMHLRNCPNICDGLVPSTAQRSATPTRLPLRMSLPCHCLLLSVDSIVMCPLLLLLLLKALLLPTRLLSSVLCLLDCYSCGGYCIRVVFEEETCRKDRAVDTYKPYTASMACKHLLLCLFCNLASEIITFMQ